MPILCILSVCVCVCVYASIHNRRPASWAGTVTPSFTKEVRGQEAVANGPDNVCANERAEECGKECGNACKPTAPNHIVRDPLCEV